MPTHITKPLHLVGKTLPATTTPILPPPRKQVGHHMSVYSSALTGLCWLYLSDKRHTQAHNRRACRSLCCAPTRPIMLFPNKTRREIGFENVSFKVTQACMTIRLHMRGRLCLAKKD